MTSTHQFSLTLLGAITATMLAVTATIASFVVIPTPQARSAEAIIETEATTETFTAPALATIAEVRIIDATANSTLHGWTADVHNGR